MQHNNVRVDGTNVISVVLDAETSKQILHKDFKFQLTSVVIASL